MGGGGKKRTNSTNSFWRPRERNDPSMIKIIWVLYDFMSDTTFYYLPAAGGIFWSESLKNMNVYLIIT